MSMWKLDLEGFPQQWMGIADAFEQGVQRLFVAVEDEKSANKKRFEWYAFKRKLRDAEEGKPLEERMYQVLPRITVEVGKMKDGRWALRFSTRDTGSTARALEAALAMTPEEVERMNAEFESLR